MANTEIRLIVYDDATNDIAVGNGDIWTAETPVEANGTPTYDSLAQPPSSYDGYDLCTQPLQIGNTVYALYSDSVTYNNKLQVAGFELQSNVLTRTFMTVFPTKADNYHQGAATDGTNLYVMTHGLGTLVGDWPAYPSTRPTYLTWQVDPNTGSVTELFPDGFPGGLVYLPDTTGLAIANGRLYCAFWAFGGYTTNDQNSGIASGVPGDSTWSDLDFITDFPDLPATGRTYWRIAGLTGVPGGGSYLWFHAHAASINATWLSLSTAVPRLYLKRPGEAAQYVRSFGDTNRDRLFVVWAGSNGEMLLRVIDDLADRTRSYWYTPDAGVTWSEVLTPTDEASHPPPSVSIAAGGKILLARTNDDNAYNIQPVNTSTGAFEAVVWSISLFNFGVPVVGWLGSYAPAIVERANDYIIRVGPTPIPTDGQHEGQKPAYINGSLYYWWSPYTPTPAGNTWPAVVFTSDGQRTNLNYYPRYFETTDFRTFTERSNVVLTAGAFTWSDVCKEYLGYPYRYYPQVAPTYMATGMEMTRSEKVIYHNNVPYRMMSFFPRQPANTVAAITGSDATQAIARYGTVSGTWTDDLFFIFPGFCNDYGSWEYPWGTDWGSYFCSDSQNIYAMPAGLNGPTSPTWQIPFDDASGWTYIGWDSVANTVNIENGRTWWQMAGLEMWNGRIWTLAETWYYPTPNVGEGYTGLLSLAPGGTQWEIEATTPWEAPSGGYNDRFDIPGFIYATDDGIFCGAMSLSRGTGPASLGPRVYFYDGASYTEIPLPARVLSAYSFFLSLWWARGSNELFVGYTTKATSLDSWDYGWQAYTNNGGATWTEWEVTAGSPPGYRWAWYGGGGVIERMPQVVALQNFDDESGNSDLYNLTTSDILTPATPAIDLGPTYNTPDLVGSIFPIGMFDPNASMELTGTGWTPPGLADWNYEVLQPAEGNTVVDSETGQYAGWEAANPPPAPAPYASCPWNGQLSSYAGGGNSALTMHGTLVSSYPTKAITQAILKVSAAGYTDIPANTVPGLTMRWTYYLDATEIATHDYYGAGAGETIVDVTAAVGAAPRATFDVSVKFELIVPTGNSTLYFFPSITRAELYVYTER